MGELEHIDGPTYSRSEMLEVLSQRGLTPPTTRTFSDWIDKGLIDRSTRRGAGRGKGSQAGRWPTTQLELLAAIVAKREVLGEMKAPVIALTNIPTFVWLGWGEEYVPLRQVRRAVGTWAEFYIHRRGAWEKANVEAARLAKITKGLGARRANVSAFAKALAESSTSKRLEVSDLLDLGRRVIDPENIGREFGAPGASLDPEKLMLGLVVPQYASEHAVRDRLNDLRGSSKSWFQDSHYRQARQAWFEAVYQYQHLQPLLRAAGPAELYERLTLQDIGNKACLHVLLLMGLADPRMPRTWEQPT